MFDSHRWLAAAAALWAFPLAGQTEYLPLYVGNQWVYQQTGRGEAGAITVAVTRTATFGGVEYSRVEGLEGGPVWLRMGEDGTVYRYLEAKSAEGVWASFGAGAEKGYSTVVDPCSPQAVLERPAEAVKLPVGEFWNAVRIRYPGGACADAGMVEDVFLPHIGLARRVWQTIAGPRTMELTYARIGGILVISQPELGFSISLDRAEYKDGPLRARLTLRNTQEVPVEVTFPSGQRYDLAIKTPAGREVWRWSDGKMFPMVFGQEQIGPGERNWSVEAPLRTRDGARLEPGTYVAEGWLATQPAGLYRASAAFEIR